MKTTEMYEIGEQVLIPAKVVKREFDDRGEIKYRLKDNKTGKIFDWNYACRDLITPIEKRTMKKESK